jgi:hypothetical protein
MPTKKLVVLEWDGEWSGDDGVVETLQRVVDNCDVDPVREARLRVRELDRLEGREALLSTYGSGPGE